MTRRATLHPILFSLYTVLFAYANHIDFAPPVGTIAALLVLFGACAALLSRAAARAIGDEHKAAVVASAFIIMFSSYGHLRNLLLGPFDEFRVLSVGIGPQKILLCAWTIVWVSLWRWLKGASPSAMRNVTTFLNRAAVVLMLLSGVTLAMALYSSTREQQAERNQIAGDSPTPPSQAQIGGRRLPDIYYIILDGYARADVLKEVYHYDNGEFVDWLRAAGFYVADESRSNYLQTMLSLASSLNSVYLKPAQLTSLDSTGGSHWHIVANSATARYLDRYLDSPRRPLVHMIQYSEVARTLKEHGYRFVALTSGFGGVQLPHADVVLRTNVLTDFEESLMGTTPIAELERLYDPLELHRQRVLYALDHLADTLAGDGPHFVFAHIMSPHPPFIFGPDGSPVRADPSGRQIIFADDVAGTSEGERAAVERAYQGQVRFVNGRIKKALAAILARAETPPIIVLQSDHGSDMLMDWANPSPAAIRERTGILNAYYVPREIRAKLYPGITPVNTFRILLGQCFSRGDDLVPDETYFSTYESPYALVPLAVR